MIPKTHPDCGGGGRKKRRDCGRLVLIEQFTT